MKKAYSVEIHGKVQGVGFRYHALAVARECNLAGFVKNRSDGSVYIEMEGDEGSCARLIEWCRQGPARALVNTTHVMEIPISGYNKFEIR